MTDGNSQGLFIVVAIVIFGIFVALSYTVFGSDGLSGGIEDLFSSGISMGADSFNRRVDVPFTHIVRKPSTSNMDVFEYSDTDIEYYSDGLTLWGDGISINSSTFDLDTEYVLSFNITKLSGHIDNIGGHLHMSEKQEVYVDGVKQSSLWLDGVPFDNDKGTHYVEVHFNTDYMYIEEETGLKHATFGSDRNQPATVHIVTNRQSGTDSSDEHTVRIDNIRLQRVIGRLEDK